MKKLREINLEESKNNILKYFEYSDKDIIDISYLINLMNKLNIEDDGRESIFQFSPSFDDNGRSQRFPTFYKEMFLGDIAFKILENVGEKLNVYDKEDFALYFQDIWLNNKEKNIIFDILLKNDLLDLTVEEISDFFIKKLEKEIMIFKDF